MKEYAIQLVTMLGMAITSVLPSDKAYKSCEATRVEAYLPQNPRLGSGDPGPQLMSVRPVVYAHPKSPKVTRKTSSIRQNLVSAIL